MPNKKCKDITPEEICRDLMKWAKAWEVWGVKVDRDIDILERKVNALEEKCGLEKTEFKEGRPGAPPKPPPWDP